MSKQDRQGVRTPAQLEQKYRIGESLFKSSKQQTAQANQMEQLTQTLRLFMTYTNAELEVLKQNTGGVSNVLVGNVTGNKVILKDISPVEHTLTVKLLSNTAMDFMTVKVSRYGESETDNYETYTPTPDGIVGGVKSIFPITTLTTDTEGVVMKITYNRDLNKAI